MHVADLPPERRHIHNQVFDDREVAERRNLDVAVPFKFFAERGAACQFLAAVDRHRTRATNRRAAGVAKCQAPVALMLDPNEGIEDGHPAADIEPKLFRMGCGIDFRIESLNRKSETHTSPVT